MGKSKSSKAGANELALFVASEEVPKFNAFVKENQDKFKGWHKSKTTVEKLERKWRRRFINEANRLGKQYKIAQVRTRRDRWKTICSDIEINVNKTLALQAHEATAWKTQELLIKKINNELHGEIQEQSLSTLSSQNTASESSVEIEVPDSSPWKIGRTNLSTKLNAFRNKAMGKLHLGNERLSRSELLAINYIYYFDAGERNDIFSHLLHLSDDILEAMVEDIDREDQYKPLSPEIKECLDIFEESMQDADFARVNDLLKTKYDRTGEDKNVVQILENIYLAYDNTNVTEVDEDRFGDIVFKPIFGHIIRDIPYARIDE